MEIWYAISLFFLDELAFIFFLFSSREKKEDESYEKFKVKRTDQINISNIHFLSMQIKFNLDEHRIEEN